MLCCVCMNFGLRGNDGGKGVGEKKVAGDGGLLRSRAFWSEYTENLQTLLR